MPEQSNATAARRRQLRWSWHSSARCEAGHAACRAHPRCPSACPASTARQIDVPMSNCINSGISKIYILTQFNSTSLNRHLARTYK